MKSSSHDTIVYRLAQILIKLNNGEKLDPLRLADEFGVNLRTIQRDLNGRFAYLPLQKTDGRYYLNPVFLGKLSSKDIQQFAALSGVKGLFPSLGDDFLRDIFDTRTQEALLVKGHNFEDMAGREQLFRDIEHAIIGHKCISFAYQKSGIMKNYESICPYKLLNLKGIWYLAATDSGKLKTFSLAKIERLRVMNSMFLRAEEITARITVEEGIWFSEQEHEVVVEVSAEVAGYFRRRKLIANQVVEKEMPDGRLLISSRVGHPNQVLPIIRYWIPHVRIVRPALWQEELTQSLKDYLRKINDQ